MKNYRHCQNPLTKGMDNNEALTCRRRLSLPELERKNGDFPCFDPYPTASSDSNEGEEAFPFGCSAQRSKPRSMDCPRGELMNALDDAPERKSKRKDFCFIYSNHPKRKQSQSRGSKIASFINSLFTKMSKRSSLSISSPNPCLGQRQKSPSVKSIEDVKRSVRFTPENEVDVDEEQVMAIRGESGRRKGEGEDVGQDVLNKMQRKEGKEGTEKNEEGEDDGENGYAGSYSSTDLFELNHNGGGTTSLELDAAANLWLWF